jgi:hypothetical protein
MIPAAKIHRAGNLWPPVSYVRLQRSKARLTARRHSRQETVQRIVVVVGDVASFERRRQSRSDNHNVRIEESS